MKQTIHQLGLEQLTIIVNIGGKKNHVATPKQRVEMIEAMLFAEGIDRSRVHVEAVESNMREQFIEPIISRARPDGIVQVIGEDSFRLLQKEALNRESTSWMVVPRPDQSDPTQRIEDVAETVKGRVYVLKLDMDIGTSSTQVRKYAAMGLYNPRMVHPRVVDYIQHFGLYRGRPLLPACTGLADKVATFLPDSNL